MDLAKRINAGSKFWIYLAVMLLYYLLIGVVITVLLLAPKYTASTSFAKKNWVRNEFKEKVDPSSPVNQNQNPAPNSPSYPPHLSFFNFDDSLGDDGIPLLPPSEEDREQKPAIFPSRRDPIFDIDPRSNAQQQQQQQQQHGQQIVVLKEREIMEESLEDDKVVNNKSNKTLIKNDGKILKSSV